MHFLLLFSSTFVLKIFSTYAVICLLDKLRFRKHANLSQQMQKYNLSSSENLTNIMHYQFSFAGKIN